MNHTEIPSYSKKELSVRKSKYCIITALWNEGEKALTQYRSMKRYTAESDFIIAIRGEDLDKFSDEELKEQFGIRTILKIDSPGQSTAYRVAMSYALDQGYEGIIMIDSNGKDSPSAFPSFIEKLDQGYDLVQGSRFMKGGYHENTPLIRIFAIRCVAAFWIWLGSGYWYSDQNNGFKGFSRRVLLDDKIQPLRSIFKFHNLQVYLNYAIPKHGFKVVQVPTSRVYPKTGPLPSKLKGITPLIRHLKDYIDAAIGRLDP